MGHHRNPLIGVLFGAVLTALPLFGVHAEVLVYKGENKWVAAEDNMPLQALLKAARSGKTTYKVKLPTEQRELAIVRLEVVRDLLAREAKAAVVMIEDIGTAKKDTLVVE